MDYTTNYHLPQWVESDRILMEDFNQAMAAIDSGIKAAQDTADSGATAASAAQDTADRAEGKADSAQTAADAAGSAAADLAAIAYTTENKPFVTGSYTGNGSSTYRTINLGFRPSAVLIGCSTATYTGTDTVFFSSGNVVGKYEEFGIVDSGFKVKTGVSSSSNYWLNTEGSGYDYLAFE